MGIIQNIHNIKYKDEETGKIKTNITEISYDVPNV
jgi:hypothetical protein